MSTLVWDEVGERRYETGVDHGVLYIPGEDATLAVPWNGLVSVTEESTVESKSYYLDGVKFLEVKIPGDYSGKIQAYTYPDELDDVIGIAEFAPGAFLHDQFAKVFHLAYRTKIGNDLDGLDHGYRLHILYNLLAIPSARTYTTIAPGSNPPPLEWTISATPQMVYGIRPTAHISFNSRLLDAEALQAIEDTLYGTESTEPTLLHPAAIFSLLEAYIPVEEPPYSPGTLLDDSFNNDYYGWTHNGSGGFAIADGVLTLDGDSEAWWPNYSTGLAASMPGGVRFTVNLLSVNDTGGQHEIKLIWKNIDDVYSYISFCVPGADETLIGYEYDGVTLTDWFITPFDPVYHKWLRLELDAEREVLSWSMSSNGTTWSELQSHTLTLPPTGFPISEEVFISVQSESGGQDLVISRVILEGL